MRVSIVLNTTMRGSPYPDIGEDPIPGGPRAWREHAFTHEEWRRLFHPGREGRQLNAVYGVLKEQVREISPKILEGVYLMGRQEVLGALLANENFGPEEARWLYQRITDELVHLSLILENTGGSHDEYGQEERAKSGKSVEGHAMDKMEVMRRAYSAIHELAEEGYSPEDSTRQQWLEVITQSPHFCFSTSMMPPSSHSEALVQGLLATSATTEQELLQLEEHLRPVRMSFYCQAMNHPGMGQELAHRFVKQLRKAEGLSTSLQDYLAVFIKNNRSLQYPKVQKLIQEEGTPPLRARLIQHHPELLLPTLRNASQEHQGEIVMSLGDSFDQQLTREQIQAMLALESDVVRRQAVRWSGRQTCQAEHSSNTSSLSSPTR